MKRTAIFCSLALDRKKRMDSLSDDLTNIVRYWIIVVFNWILLSSSYYREDFPLSASALPSSSLLIAYSLFFDVKSISIVSHSLRVKLESLLQLW